MPTQPKPPPRHEVEEVLLGLFGWLRATGCTEAARPIRAKREIYGALRSHKLHGAAQVIGVGFLVALDTWIHLAAPELRHRGGPSADRLGSETDERRRAEVLSFLQALSLDRLTELVSEIAVEAANRARLGGASQAEQTALRSRWLRDAEMLEATAHALEMRLRAPLGVPFPRTLKEWNAFEQALIAELRAFGMSYAEITKITRPKAQTGRRSVRAERERVRGSARRARARRA